MKVYSVKVCEICDVCILLIYNSCYVICYLYVYIWFVYKERDESAYNEMLDEKRNKMLQIQKELDEQKTKLDRAQKQNSKLAREVRNAVGSKAEVPEEVSNKYIMHKPSIDVL